MTSPVPTSATTTRRLLVLASTLFAVIIGQAQIFMGWGQSPAEFAADSDATLRVAGFAFAIWGIIYAWLLVYAVRQTLPATVESPLLKVLGWPSIAALLAIGWWIVAAALDWETGTIVLIFGALLVLLIPLLAKAAAIRALPRGDPDRWMTVWPLALLAGWLSIAAPVNLLTVVTGNGDLPAALPPTGWAILAVAVVAALALGVTARLRTPAFALPVAWGLIGVFSAEQPRNAVLAFTALAAAIAVLIGAVILVFRLAPRVRAAPDHVKADTSAPSR
ncbi:hypothetical protein [uncultured Brevundimonas sp.]|uniref:hypothetical protein n=1 Tax=uncultured Brevundimonas sp. TaxID=213418 RepID=UPI0030EC0F98